jgi:hypothetical protein
MELAHSHLVKAASGDQVYDEGPGFNNNGTVKPITQSTLTEGEVPWYEADKPYPGKSAAAGTPLTAESVALMIKAAVGEVKSASADDKMDKILDALSKTPAGPRSGRLFAVPSKAEMIAGEDGEKSDNALLYDGVTPQDLQDPGAAIKAAGTVMANILGNPGRFGKSVNDPSFKGGAVK